MGALHKLGTEPVSGRSVLQKVLVVDDSKMQRKSIVAYLRNWGFEIFEAATGEEALQIIEEVQPHLILSDWMMPGMDGLEFCRRFRALEKSSYGYFILLTVKGEKHEVAEGLNAGADDFLTKPINMGELRARIAAGERILRMHDSLFEKHREVADTLHELQGMYNTIDKDLLQAKKIQESLVPSYSGSFSGSKVNLLLKPCGHIGGDLVGMFSPGPGRLGFYNIDVSGHGITSAMMTARLGGYLSGEHFDQNVAMEKRFNRFYALRQPAEVAELLNKRLIAEAGIEEYFTMAYGIADLRHGVVKLVQAGHPHPLVLRADGRTEFIGEGGLPIGLIADVEFQQIEVRLNPGDALLFYSDGFTEAKMADGEMLENEGLIELVAECRAECRDRGLGQEFLDDLFWRLKQRMPADSTMDDDVSALLFEYGDYQPEKD